MMILLNAFCAVIFWHAADQAWDDDRPVWAYVWLFLSALNGASILSVVF